MTSRILIIGSKTQNTTCGRVVANLDTTIPFVDYHEVLLVKIYTITGSGSGSGTVGILIVEYTKPHYQY